MIAAPASGDLEDSEIGRSSGSAEWRSSNPSWSGRATASIALVLGAGMVAIGIERLLGYSPLSTDAAVRAGSTIDSMALALAVLSFAAVGSHNRAAPNRLNVVTGAILALLAVLVLPIDLVLSNSASIGSTALVIAAQVSIVTLSFIVVLRPAGESVEKLRQVVALVLVMTIMLAGLVDVTIRAAGLDHEVILRWSLGFAAFLLALSALRLGAFLLRANDPRAMVLALTLIGLGVANTHASLIESGSLATTAGKAMRLVVIAAILMYTVVQLRDLALREREIALLAQNESDRAADRLVAQMTFQERFVHDTRTALLAIQGGLRSLDGGPDQMMIKAVSSEVERLRTLLDGPDDDPLPVTFDVAEALKPMISCYKANGNNIKLIAHSPVLARGHPSIAAEVAQNLIENAMAQSEAGEVTVRVFAYDDLAKVHVADRGRGVDIDLRESIFDHGTSGGSGSGVGLHISRRLIELQGGSIEVTDRHGGGALFAFTLPLAATEHTGGHMEMLARQ